MTFSHFSRKSFSYLLLFITAGLIAVFLTIIGQRLSDLPIAEETYSAGGTTTFYNRSSHAFGQPAPGLNGKEMSLHTEGDATFDAVFVTSPAPINPGLGPEINSSSCGGCHIKNGRGMPQLGQALVRTSLPAASGAPVIKTEGVVPDPGFGHPVAR